MNFVTMRGLFVWVLGGTHEGTRNHPGGKHEDNFKSGMDGGIGYLAGSSFMQHARGNTTGYIRIQ